MSLTDKTFVFLVYFILSLILVIVLYPLLYVVAASFSDPQAVIRGEVFIFPVRPTLRGYEAVFQKFPPSSPQTCLCNFFRDLIHGHQ